MRLIFNRNLFVISFFLFSSFAHSQWIGFGSKGAPGPKGQNGKSGRSGRNVTLKTEGAQRVLVLKGEDGYPGYDGQDGRDAFNCWQRRGEWNMIGAPGGKGGDGGNGGSGGHGGHSTIYFSDLEDLKNLTIIAEGGRGSFGGRGNIGGRPCFCTYRHWRVRYEDTDGKVFYRDFQCLNGERGTRGRQGKNGRDGRLGRVSLIKGSSPLRPETPSRIISFKDFNKDIDLSRNIWENKRNLLNLIDPSSIVSNNYRLFKDRKERTIKFLWNSRRALKRALGEKTISLQFRDDIFYTFPRDFWIKAQEEINRYGGQEVSISHLVSPQDIKSIRPKEINLDGKETNLIIKEEEDLDFIKSEFFIVTKWRLEEDYWSYYKGKIPRNLIERRGNAYHINLGGLPVREKSFKKKANFTLTIKRSFENYEAQIGPLEVKKSKGKPLEVQEKVMKQM